MLLRKQQHCAHFWTLEIEGRTGVSGPKWTILNLFDKPTDQFIAWFEILEAGMAIGIGIALGTGLGTAFGAAMGAAFGDVRMGVVFGPIVGASIGLIVGVLYRFGNEGE